MKYPAARFCFCNTTPWTARRWPPAVKVPWIRPEAAKRPGGPEGADYLVLIAEGGRDDLRRAGARLLEAGLDHDSGEVEDEVLQRLGLNEWSQRQPSQDNLTLQNHVRIGATTANSGAGLLRSGRARTLTTRAPEVDLSGSLYGLKASLLGGSTQRREECARRLGLEFSSFLVPGRGSVQPAPEDWFASDPIGSGRAGQASP